ncbi:hypothetical protein BDF14DRAFT_1716803 [Spinellus fusiger]|nr:hypothetical protein BDF14DRAFT_1716803 [Spinellus fusiger]
MTQQKDKIDAFRGVLTDILASSSKTEQMDNLKAHVNALLDDQVGLVIARPLLSEFIGLFNKRITDSDTKKTLLLYTIQQAQSRAVSFEEQLSHMRETLADQYEAEDDYLKAAKTLQGISLDSGHRAISDDYKLGIYIRIVRLLLEEEEAVAAEAYLNRAALLLPTTPDLVVGLTFKLSQARILDAKRRFLEACQKYHELSYVPQLSEEERLRCLMAAVQCAVLARAGPLRSRSLATLYKDERTHHLALFSILEKTYLERVIRANEVSEFAATLKPHHLARLTSNTTVFERAMIEHNLLSASKIYNNISFDELGSLLNVSSEQAEQVASHMIGENRMVGCIDQIDHTIFFESGGATFDQSSQENSISAAAAAANGTTQPNQQVQQSMLEIVRWDAGIQTLCQDMDSIITTIQERYPEYASAHFNAMI